MEILIRLDRFDMFPPTGTHQKRSEALFSTVEDIYYSCCSDSEAYLRDGIHDEDFVFGDEQPQTIIQRAESWNARLQEDARQALEKLEQVRLSNGGLYPMDSLDTYDARKALLALDNRFYDYAEYATCLGEDQDSFETIIREDELQDIQAHPERYALVEIYPK